MRFLSKHIHSAVRKTELNTGMIIFIYLHIWRYGGVYNISFVHWFQRYRTHPLCGFDTVRAGNNNCKIIVMLKDI